MQRRDFLKTASICGVGTLLPNQALPEAALASAPAASAVKQPNILLIVSDQHRAGITKRNDQINDAVYEKHLYQLAKESGYRTGLAGKNHTFLKATDTDFWREYGHDTGWIPPDAPAIYHDFQRWMTALRANVALEPTPFPLEMQFPYRIVSDAIEFMSASDERPFLLQVGFSEPHDPEQVPAPYWNMFAPESVPDRCAGPEALKQLGYGFRSGAGIAHGGTINVDNSRAR